MKGDDIIGEKFNHLTVLERIGSKKFPKGGSVSVYKCRCDCGNIIEATRNDLMYDNKKSCGCMNPSKFQDLTGKKFGRLTVIKKDHLGSHGDTMWLCKYDCGNTKVISGHSLRMGRTLSCGCYNKELITTHGESKTRLYGVWIGMKTRCYNKNSNNYSLYGGRGIKICDEWQKFENFRNWAMVNGYNPNAEYGECTIDRINKNGNYEPSNCRFVSMGIQDLNRRSNIDFRDPDNKYISKLGDGYVRMSEVARQNNIPYSTIYGRYKTGKYDIDDIFSKQSFRERPLTAFGKTQSIAVWSRELNIPHATICSRLSRGCSPEEALSKMVPSVPKVIEYQGVAATIEEWNRAMKLPENTVYNRLKRGFNVEKSITMPRFGQVPGLYGIDENGKPIPLDD